MLIDKLYTNIFLGDLGVSLYCGGNKMTVGMTFVFVFDLYRSRIEIKSVRQRWCKMRILKYNVEN